MKTKRTKKYVRKPSPKMLRHLKRLAKLLHQRAVDRRAAEAKKAATKSRKKTA